MKKSSKKSRIQNNLSVDTVAFYGLLIAQVIGLVMVMVFGILSYVFIGATSLDSALCTQQASCSVTVWEQWSPIISKLIKSTQNITLLIGLLTLAAALLGVVSKRMIAHHKPWLVGLLSAVISLIYLSQKAESLVSYVISTI